MGVIIKASDLKFKYPRNVVRRDEPKFAGLPDPHPFDRNDLYEILPMMTAAMNEFASYDGGLLHLLEDLLNDMPSFVSSREEVFDYLLGSVRECMR